MMEELQKRFESTAIACFRFLEDEFSLTRSEMRSHNESEPRDAYVEIRHEGRPVAVRVIFSHGSGSLNLQLIDETSDLLRKHRTVDFESLVEFHSGGEIKPIISPITEGISFAEMGRRADARAELVDRDLETTLAALATKLRQHGAVFLQGETQVFAEYRKSIKPGRLPD